LADTLQFLHLLCTITMYNVTPVPEDEKLLQKFIQDRRVLGVSYVLLARVPYPLMSVCQYDPLVQPALLLHEVTASDNSKLTISSARYHSARILAGQDDRVLVVVGPCSIHSPDQAIEYAQRLKEKMPSWDNLLIVMRAYL